MRTSPYLKSLIILAISVLLNMPGILMADHMHEASSHDHHDEVQCEICSAVGSDSTDRSLTCDNAVPKHQEIQKKVDFIPVETYLFHKHQRGPPLLR